MRISDWSSDVCSSDLDPAHRRGGGRGGAALAGLNNGEYAHILCARRMAMNRPARFEGPRKASLKKPTNVSLSAALVEVAKTLGINVSEACQTGLAAEEIGRASGRARVCQYVSSSVVAGTLKKKK